jgi:OOP family OmpA-OmpF porin
MKKLLTTLIVAAAGAASAQTVDNWTASGAPVRNGTQELCWRDASWTPATAHPDCDGALKKPRVTATVPAPVAPVAKPAPQPVAVKQSYAADAFFDFDKTVIKPEGRAKLNTLIANINNITLEVVIAVGHTDSVGTDTYNQKLGQRRADAVRAYLVSQGIDPKRVYTESRGELKPIADNRTAVGRARNRRVEIEVIGTRR